VSRPKNAKLRLFNNETELSTKTVRYIADQEVKEILKDLRLNGVDYVYCLKQFDTMYFG
jgi:hypothetical protein